MSQSEIRYIVPEESRRLGDTEKILNAMGAFMEALPFPRDHEYEVIPSEVDETVLVVLKRTTREPLSARELRQEAEDVQNSVGERFDIVDRERLKGHFVKIALDAWSKDAHNRSQEVV